MNTNLLLARAQLRLEQIKKAIEENDKDALISCAVCSLCTEDELEGLNEYEVIVQETLQTKVKVKAHNKQDAIAVAAEMYEHEEIMLDYRNHTKTEFFNAD